MRWQASSNSILYSCYMLLPKLKSKHSTPTQLLKKYSFHGFRRVLVIFTGHNFNQ